MTEVLSFRAIAGIQEVFLSFNIREKNNIDSPLLISGMTISPSHPDDTFLYFAIVRILSFNYTYKNGLDS
ncbi:MAG TPA: hypothetical protein PLD35_04720 [Caldisericia bacterium]|nr:hypothetical protein [Caldisericia bacterium]HQJ40858.1 hypothetical protein [Exilispira sp.]HXK69851.1 hypothetical protein [Caldisericia bacterium]